MPRKKKPIEQRRAKLNLTIHPDIRGWADEISLKRRRSLSQLFEELVEAEWVRHQQPHAPASLPPAPPAYLPPQPYPFYYHPPQAPTGPAGQ